MRTMLVAFALLCFALPCTRGWCQSEPDAGVAPAAAADQKSGTVDLKKKDEDKQPLPESALTLPADAVVLTIKGLCPEVAAENTALTKPSSDPAACQTVITKAQFEELTNAIHPNMPPTTKRQLAVSYPRLLAMAHEAEQRGLEQKTHYKEMIAFARLQILSQDLVREIQEEASEISEKDVENYYTQNKANFETATLERITVPNIRQNQTSSARPVAQDSVSQDPASQDKSREEKDKQAMKAEAESLRGRAAAGEDFGKLQKDAYTFAGLTTPPPLVTIPKARKSSLPAAHASVLDLKAGEVSEVISDPGGFYIYKVVSKETEPQSEAENEIRKILTSERARSMLQTVQDSITTELNPSYFGPASGKHHAASQKTDQNRASSATSATDEPK